MANSYTISPGTVVGNQTVTGNEIIQGFLVMAVPAMQAGSPLETVGLPIMAFLNAVSVAHTGTTTEDTQFTTTIPANLLRTNGQLRLWLYVSVAAQGATATTIRVRYGGVVVASFTFATVADRILELVIANQGSAGAQRNGARLDTNNAVPAFSFLSTAVDSTVAQALSVTVQNGTSTDSQTFQSVHGLLTSAAASI